MEAGCGEVGVESRLAKSGRQFTQQVRASQCQGEPKDGNDKMVGCLKVSRG